MCVCICLSLCSHMSPLERLFVLKSLSRTQRTMYVKNLFSLKLLRCRATALLALYGYRAVGHFRGHFLTAELYARALAIIRAILTATIQRLKRANNWRAKRANLVVLCARFFFPGQWHTVISNLAITRIILNPFYNAAVYTLRIASQQCIAFI